MPRSTAVRVSDGPERQSKTTDRPTWVEELEEAERERHCLNGGFSDMPPSNEYTSGAEVDPDLDPLDGVFDELVVEAVEQSEFESECNLDHLLGDLVITPDELLADHVLFEQDVTAEQSVEQAKQPVDLGADLDALEDFTNGLISEAKYNAIVAAYEAKYPQPQLTFKKPEPWESISSNFPPALRKLAWENSISSTAKNATKSANENHAQPVAKPAFAENPSRRCPVAVLLSPPTRSSAGSSPSSTCAPSASAQRVLAAANENQTPWTKASNVQKFHGSIEVAEHENGFAFSLNLSQARIKKLMADAANGNDPKRRLSHDFNRYLKKHLGHTPPYCFGFEFDADGRFHAHGAIIARDSSDPNRKLLHRALSAVGGKIKGRAGSTQAHSTEIYYGTGWFLYTTKWHSRTRKLLGVDNVTFINEELKQMTREAWGAPCRLRRPWLQHLFRPL